MPTNPLSEDLIYLHALKRLSDRKKLNFGDSKFIEVRRLYGSFENFVQRIDDQDLLASLESELEQSKKSLAQYQNLGIQCTDYFANNFPGCLKQLIDPPSIIYYCGDLSSFDSSKSLSIVGTRNASLYGKHSTRAIVKALRGYDTCIVSGLAKGIDTEAHISALENQIPTVAVLGSGFLRIAHWQNEIVIFMRRHPHNLIISEFEPNYHAQGWTFAHRNRIISAMSKATLVIEAPLDSGSLITAEESLTLGHKLYALAAEVDKDNFQGNQRLLMSSQAEAFSSVDQIVNELNLSRITAESNPSEANPKSHPKISPLSQQILEQINLEPVSFDYLLEKLGLNQISLSTQLSILEVHGHIRRLAGAKFTKNLS
jgi:DNA processing protein